MATITSATVFDYARFLIGTGKINLSSDTLKLLPMTTGFAPTIASGSITGTAGLLADASISGHVSANLAAVALPGTVTYAQNDSTGKSELKSTVTTMVELIASGDTTVIGFCLYDDTVATPAKPMISYLLLDAPVTLASGQKIQVTMPTNGWINI